MFNNGAEIITATICVLSVLMNVYLLMERRGTVAQVDCNENREECQTKLILIDEHEKAILLIKESLKLLCPTAVVNELKTKVDNLFSELGFIRKDFKEGKDDRKEIRASVGKIAEHIRKTNNTIRVYMRLARNGGINQDALEELLKVFEDEDSR
jgi:hypothetical protein